MLFDEVTFQNQRFQFAVGDNVFEAGNVGDHLLDFWSFVAARLEVLADAVFQGDGFADIDNRVFLIVHEVDAGFGGEFFQFFFDVELHGIGLLLYGRPGQKNTFPRSPHIRGSLGNVFFRPGLSLKGVTLCFWFVVRYGGRSTGLLAA